MSWENMDGLYLRLVLKQCICDSGQVLKQVFQKGEKTVADIREKLIALEKSICTDVEPNHRNRVKGQVYELFASYRRALNTLVQLTQMPDTVELLLDSSDAREDTIKLLDHGTDGIFVFGDEDCLRLRTPSLPHRSKPVLYLSGGNGTYPITTTRIYGEAVLRTMGEAENELGVLYDRLGRKTIHILHVFANDGNPIDNDNRDTGALINSVCAYLPGGDAPDVTRIVNDGFRTDELLSGTYITVLPYDKGIADNEETVKFWKEHLSAERFTEDGL